jgi:hypothetical protein
VGQPGHRAAVPSRVQDHHRARVDQAVDRGWRHHAPKM